MEISNNQSEYQTIHIKCEKYSNKGQGGIQWFDAESVKSHRGFGIGAQNAD